MKKYFSLIAAASLGAIVSGVVVKKVWLEKYRRQRVELELMEQEREVLRIWLQTKYEGSECTAMLFDKGYQKVAILGMTWEGRLLANVLGNTAVYGVEQDNFGAIHPRLIVYRLGEDILPPADCLVVCDLKNLPEKLELAKREFKGEIITLMQMLEGTLEQHQ